MSPKEMQLQQLEAQELISGIAIKKEWVIDPAFLTRIKPELAIGIAKIRFSYLAEATKIEAEMKGLEAKMYGEMAQLLAKAR